MPDPHNDLTPEEDEQWTLVADEKPPSGRNVLLAFEEHWNPVVGFYCCLNEFFETSAHDHNSRIVGKGPKWWMSIPRVPHHGKS